MFNRVRLEMTATLALVVALAALVLAMRGSSEPAAVAQEDGATKRTAVADFVPKGAEEVQIVNFAYSPDPVRVRVGTPVAWTNRDSAPHTVTGSDGSWGSEMMAQGDTFVMTFDKPGVYLYICELHPPRHGALFRAPEGAKLVGGGGHGMQGTIVVE